MPSAQDLLDGRDKAQQDIDAAVKQKIRRNVLDPLKSEITNRCILVNFGGDANRSAVDRAVQELRNEGVLGKGLRAKPYITHNFGRTVSTLKISW